MASPTLAPRHIMLPMQRLFFAHHLFHHHCPWATDAWLCTFLQTSPHSPPDQRRRSTPLDRYLSKFQFNLRTRVAAFRPGRSRRFIMKILVVPQPALIHVLAISR
jgi:hypothetical protein